MTGAAPCRGLRRFADVRVLGVELEPASCQRSRTCARSGRGCALAASRFAAATTRRMPQGARKLAEGKSWGKTIQRLSNFPGAAAGPTYGAPASSRKAGGAPAGAHSRRISSAPALSWSEGSVRTFTRAAMVTAVLKSGTGR